MQELLGKIVAGILSGDWDAVFAEASSWVKILGEETDSRPYFALNVVHLIRGWEKEKGHSTFSSSLARRLFVSLGTEPHWLMRGGFRCAVDAPK